MENLNSTSTNVSTETKENSNVANVPASKEKKSAKKSVSKKKETDSINVEKIKIDLSKGKKDLLTKEKSVSGKKDLYKSVSHLSTEEQKKFRGKIRRDLHRFVNSILGKDRSNEERIASVKEFISFYKTNWKFVDFKIENFTHTNNSVDRKDYETLLKYVQSVLK